MQISTLYLQCIICIRELYRIHNELQLSRLSTGSQEAEAGNIKGVRAVLQPPDAHFVIIFGVSSKILLIQFLPSYRRAGLSYSGNRILIYSFTAFTQPSNPIAPLFRQRS